jgi:fatty acid desaturase
MLDARRPIQPDASGRDGSALAALVLALPAAVAAAVAVLISGGGIIMAVVAYGFAGSATLLAAAALLASPLRLASLEAWRPRLQASDRAAAPLVGR